MIQDRRSFRCPLPPGRLSPSRLVARPMRGAADCAPRAPVAGHRRPCRARGDTSHRPRPRHLARGGSRRAARRRPRRPAGGHGTAAAPRGRGPGSPRPAAQAPRWVVRGGSGTCASGHPGRGGGAVRRQPGHDLAHRSPAVVRCRCRAPAPERPRRGPAGTSAAWHPPARCSHTDTVATRGCPEPTRPARRSWRGLAHGPARRCRFREPPGDYLRAGPRAGRRREPRSDRSGGRCSGAQPAGADDVAPA